MNTKYLIVDWMKTPRPDGRKFKVRLNKKVASVYVQISHLEVVLWYR